MSEFIHLKNIQWTAQWVTTRKKTQFSADWWPHSYQWCHHSCSSFSSSYMSWHPRVGWWGLRCMWFTANVFRKHCYAHFYFGTEKSELPALSCVSLRFDAAAGGAGGWEGEEVGGKRRRGRGWLLVCLLGQQTEVAARPQRLSVLAAGLTGLDAALSAAKPFQLRCSSVDMRFEQ